MVQGDGSPEEKKEQPAGRAHDTGNCCGARIPSGADSSQRIGMPIEGEDEHHAKMIEKYGRPGIVKQIEPEEDCGKGQRGRDDASLNTSPHLIVNASCVKPQPCSATPRGRASFNPAMIVGLRLMTSVLRSRLEHD